MPDKYVLTGGPSNGKTTTLKILEKQGFKVFDEAGRIVIGQEKKANKGKEIITYLGDVDARQKKILNLQLKNEKSAENVRGAVFFDRGIPDGIVYYRLSNTRINSKLMKEAEKEKRKYKKIFILDMLPYKMDDIRKEPEKIAMQIHKMIYDVYSELGYEIVKVPVMPPENRVSFIKSKLLN